MFNDNVRFFLVSFFGLIYQLFSIRIPGTTVTFFQVGVGFLVTCAVISFAHIFNNFSISVGGSALHHRGGNSRKISDKRYQSSHEKSINSTKERK